MRSMNMWMYMSDLWVYVERERWRMRRRSREGVCGGGLGERGDEIERWAKLHG
jgi:hypothetical protein